MWRIEQFSARSDILGELSLLTQHNFPGSQPFLVDPQSLSSTAEAFRNDGMDHVGPWEHFPVFSGWTVAHFVTSRTNSLLWISLFSLNKKCEADTPDCDNNSCVSACLSM